jgi:MurNAc alpha-1-phosphate uridylyltransferase
MAHLVMVENPPQHPNGDFRMEADGTLRADGAPKYTYSGIAVYDPRILTGWRDVIGKAPGTERSPPRFKLAPLLFDSMARGEIHGELHEGRWTDVGTPERLAALDASLTERA